MAIKRKKLVVKAHEVIVGNHHNGDGHASKDERVLSPRRSSRKRKIMSYNEEEMQKSPKLEERIPATKATPKKRKIPGKQTSTRSANKKQSRAFLKPSNKEFEQEGDDSDFTNEEEKEENGNEDVESEGDEEASDSEEEMIQKAKRTKKSASFTPTTRIRCKYCGKGFTSFGGLEYHVNRFVCRIGECKDPKITANHLKRRTRTAKMPSTHKRFRGHQNKRTCKQCGRVFTSLFGFQYHSGTLLC
jgi:hypothetical protein